MAKTIVLIMMIYYKSLKENPGGGIYSFMISGKFTKAKV